MYDREELINLYHQLRRQKNRKPFRDEFLRFANIHNRKLEAVFGGNLYTELQEACSDVPNKLALQRTPLEQILNHYGELVKAHSAIPVTAD